MSKIIDLTGKQFNSWTVLKRDENKYSDGSHWICQCNCGTVKSVSSFKLRNNKSKSCGFCNGHYGKEETGNHYGKWLVLNEKISTDHGIKWKCRCDCGSEEWVLGIHLRSGQSTQCKQCVWENQITKELPNTKYGYLTIVGPHRRGDDKYGHCEWLCKCDCGNELWVKGNNLRDGSIISCGCIHSSKGVAMIKDYLKQWNINFIQEYRIPECKNIKSLPFDFAIKKDDKLFLIEYDGRQHFEEDSWDIGDSFELRQKRDKIKNDYCKEHNIPLLRIRYDENDLIENKLKKFLEVM